METQQDELVAVTLTELITKPLSFEVWLKGHKNEDSSRGDLARDYIQSIKEDKVKGDKIKTVEESLQHHGASTEGWVTYNRAVCAYNQYKKGFEQCN